MAGVSPGSIRAYLPGTFDPVHRGHLHAARAARDALGLERVVFIMSARPSHRPPPLAGAGDRRAMLDLAVGGDPGLAVADMEIGEPGPSDTVDVLRALAAGREGPIAWLMGSDGIETFEDWKEWRAIPDLCHLVLLERPGVAAAPALPGFAPASDPAALRAAPAGRLFVVQAPMLALSATAIRAAVASGEDASDRVPSLVWEHIREHDLYRSYPP